MSGMVFLLLGFLILTLYQFCQRRAVDEEQAEGLAEIFNQSLSDEKETKD